MEEKELIKQIARGDTQALKTLYDRYAGRVYNTALSYLQQAEEAEELTQDVFLEVFQSAGRFEGKSAPGTWMYRIAVNKCLDRLRYRNRDKRRAFLQSLYKPETGALRIDPATFDHPGVSLENKERAAILFGAIDKLPENQKTAYLLTYVEDLTVKEVAEIMQINPKAVESLNSRARANLKKMLDNYYEGRRK